MSEPRSLDDLFTMYHQVCENIFLHYEERWGEPMPDGDWITAPLVIRRRIEAVIREEAVAPYFAVVEAARALIDSPYYLTAVDKHDDHAHLDAMGMERSLADALTLLPEPGGEAAADAGMPG